MVRSGEGPVVDEQQGEAWMNAQGKRDPAMITDREQWLAQVKEDILGASLADL
jgi:hypothetical protein